MLDKAGIAGIPPNSSRSSPPIAGCLLSPTWSAPSAAGGEVQGRGHRRGHRRRKLNDKNLDALKTALKSVTGKDVALNVKVDPSIIGGLVVKLGSRMVDTSLRTKLNSIKHAMKEAG